MLDYLKKRPMLLCGLIGSVICIAGYFSRTAVFYFGLLLTVVFFVMLARKVKYKYIFVAFLLLAINISVILTLNRIDKAVAADGSTVKGRFIVTENSKCHESFYSTVLEANGCKGLRNGTRIIAYSDEGGFECGNVLSAEVIINSINENYQKQYYADNIYFTGHVKNITERTEKGDVVLCVINKVRKYISDTLFSNMGYSEAATLTAIVSGDRSYLSEEFYGFIKSAGVSHVMVVSGMHLSIIVSLMTYLGERFFYNRYLKAFITFMTVIFMTALCGFTKSILRAGFCYIIYAAGIALNRENTPENTLGAAVALIFTVSPFAVFSISFQLSVLSTLGIVACALPLVKFIKDKKIINSIFLLAVMSAAAVTLFALVFTLPVTIYIFGYTSTVSLITNLLISQAVTFALSFSAIGLAVNLLFPFAARPFFILAEIIAKYINFVIKEFGSLPFATVELGKLPFIISIIVLAGVISALFACKKRLDMLKSEAVNRKVIREGGGRLKWR